MSTEAIPCIKCGTPFVQTAAARRKSVRQCQPCRSAWNRAWLRRQPKRAEAPRKRKTTTSIADRFWAQVDRSEGGCWTWRARCDRAGYGMCVVERKSRYAHRVSYELTHGEVPVGLLVCHRCDNPPCVNPSHLFLGTHADNMRDMRLKGRGPPQMKLTARDVLAIRESRDSSTVIASEFGVTTNTIRDIRRRHTWRHV